MVWWDPQALVKSHWPYDPKDGTRPYYTFDGRRYKSAIAAATAEVLSNRLWALFDVLPILLRCADGSYVVDCEPIGSEPHLPAPDIRVSKRIALGLVEAGLLLITEYNERGVPDRLELAAT
ncbi:hypothetical protein Ccr5_gp304 [Caulobacter phage Ccr5]|nr:hypothetical protein Ccr5_gp304 [Caulobacter phage Ccr5]